MTLHTNLPAWELGKLIENLCPNERMAMRWIATHADVLEVEHETYLLVRAPAPLVETLATFEAEIDDIEDEYEGDGHDDMEYDYTDRCFPGDDR